MIASNPALSLLGYMSQPFGYTDIDMNARYSTASSDYTPAGTFVPPITSRNTEQWGDVDYDPDAYTYDASRMWFPLPRHHMYFGLIEVQFMIEALLKAPQSNSTLTLRVDMLNGTGDNWVSVNSAQYGQGVSATLTHSQRFVVNMSHFINWNTGYDAAQYIIRPSVIYTSNEFRVERAFCRVHLKANSI